MTRLENALLVGAFFFAFQILSVYGVRGSLRTIASLPVVRSCTSSTGTGVFGEG